MRPVHLIALAAALLAAGPVAAQTSGWVDPPAKSAEPELGKPADVEAKSTDEAVKDVATGQARTEPRRTAMPATNAPRLPEIGHQARRLITDYLEAVSSNAAMLASASRFYGARVRFHGRSMTRAALAAEKSRFVRRWPERRYEPRGALRTACDTRSATCIVTTAFDFQARNSGRGRRSIGVGELTLTLDFSGDRPQIVSETSRVLRRGTGALSAADRQCRGA